MAGIRYSAMIAETRASCGHIVPVYIPPNGGMPGPIGRRNLAEAKACPCVDCRKVS